MLLHLQHERLELDVICPSTAPREKIATLGTIVGQQRGAKSDGDQEGYAPSPALVRLFRVKRFGVRGEKDITSVSSARGAKR